MKKLYTVEVTTSEEPYKKVVFMSAEDELEAIDKVAKNFEQEIIDIKIINK